MGYHEDSSGSPDDGAQTTPILKPSNNRTDSSNNVSTVSPSSDALSASNSQAEQSEQIDNTNGDPKTPILQIGLNDNDEDLLEKIPALPLSPPKHILRRLTPIGQFSPNGNASSGSSSSGTFLQSFDEHEQRKLKLLNEKIAKLENHAKTVDAKVNNLKVLRYLNKEDNSIKLQKKLENAQRLRDDYIEKKRRVASFVSSNILAPPPSIASNSFSTALNEESSASSPFMDNVRRNAFQQPNQQRQTTTSLNVATNSDATDSCPIKNTSSSTHSIVSDEEIAGIINVFFKFPQFTRQTNYSRRIKYEKVVNFVSSKFIVDSLVKVFRYFDVISLNNLGAREDKLGNKSNVPHDVYIKSFLYGFLTISENYQHLKNQAQPSYDTRLDSNNFNYNDLIPNIHKAYLDDAFNSFLVEKFIKQSITTWNLFTNFINSMKDNILANENKIESRRSNQECQSSNSSILSFLKSSPTIELLKTFADNFNSNYLPLFQVYKNHHKQRSLLLLKRSIYNLQRHGFFIDVSKKTETDANLLHEYTEIGSLIQNQLIKLQEQYDNLKRTSGGANNHFNDEDNNNEMEYGHNNSVPLNFDFINDEFPDDFNYHYLNNELRLDHYTLDTLEKNLIIDHNNQLLSSLLSTDNPLALNKSAASISVASPLSPTKGEPLKGAFSPRMPIFPPSESTDENAANIFSSSLDDDHGHPTDLRKNMVLVPPQFTVNQWREHLIKVVLDYRIMVSSKTVMNGATSQNFVPLKAGRPLTSASGKNSASLSADSLSDPSFLEYIEYQWSPNVESIRRFLDLKTYLQGYDEAVERLSSLPDSETFINMMGDISSMVFRTFHALYIVIRNKNGKISIVLPTSENPNVNIYDSFRMKHKNDISQIVDLVFLMKRFKNEDFSMFEYFGLVLNILLEEVPFFLKEEGKCLIKLLNDFETEYNETRHNDDTMQTQGGFVWLSDTSTTLGSNKSKYAAIDKLMTKEFIQKFIEFIKDCMVFGLNNWVFNCTRMAVIYKSGNGIIHLERRLFSNGYDSVDHSDIIENKFCNTFELIRTYKDIVKPMAVNGPRSSNEFNGTQHSNSPLDMELMDKFGVVENISSMTLDQSALSSVDCYDYFNNLFVEYICSDSMSYNTPEQFDSFLIELGSLTRSIDSLISTQSIAIILMSDLSRFLNRLPQSVSKRQPSKFIDFAVLLKSLFDYLSAHSSCKNDSNVDMSEDFNIDVERSSRLSKHYKREILDIFVQNSRTCLAENNFTTATINNIVSYIFDEKKVFSLIEKTQVLNIDGANKSLKSLFSGYLKNLLKFSKFQHGLIPSLSTEYEIGDEKYFEFYKGSSDSSEEEMMRFSSFITDSNQLDEDYSKISEFQGKFFKDTYIQSQLNQIVARYYNFFNLCFEIHWLDFMAVYRRWLNLLVDEYSESQMT